jgi:hypothetical protein
VSEFIDPVLAKTSPKRWFSMTEKQVRKKIEKIEKQAFWAC